MWIDRNIVWQDLIQDQQKLNRLFYTLERIMQDSSH